MMMEASVFGREISLVDLILEVGGISSAWHAQFVRGCKHP
jgi:hypothetical protein